MFKKRVLISDQRTPSLHYFTVVFDTESNLKFGCSNTTRQPLNAKDEILLVIETMVSTLNCYFSIDISFTIFGEDV